MINGSKPCGQPCEAGLRSIPEMTGSGRLRRSLHPPALSVLFIALMSSLCPARAHSFLSNPPMIWPDGEVTWDSTTQAPLFDEDEII